MKIKILIGDDNEAFIKSIKRMLIGLDIDYFLTPEEVIANAEARAYDAIITDLEYTEEGREGYDILEKVRELSPIRVLYSGKADQQDVIEAAYAAGATYIIEKSNVMELRKILMG